jgi:hypothetical protein
MHFLLYRCHKRRSLSIAAMTGEASFISITTVKKDSALVATMIGATISDTQEDHFIPTRSITQKDNFITTT